MTRSPSSVVSDAPPLPVPAVPAVAAGGGAAAGPAARTGLLRPPAGARDVVLTVVVLVVLWQVAAQLWFRDSVALSSPLEVARQGWADRELITSNTLATIRIAVPGFLVRSDELR